MTASVNPQVWWWLARASGIVAWTATAMTIIWGLALSGKLVRKRRIPAWLLDLHRYLGALTVFFVGVHMAGLAADSYVDFDLADLFVPMASGWQPAAVAWGIAALYLLLLVELSSLVMKRLPRRLWHAVHLSSFLVFASGSIHGVTAGTDAARPIVQVGALAVTTIVLSVVAFRVLGASGRIADLVVARSAAATHPSGARQHTETSSGAPDPAPPTSTDAALAARLERLGNRARVRVRHSEA